MNKTALLAALHIIIATGFQLRATYFTILPHKFPNNRPQDDIRVTRLLHQTPQTLRNKEVIKKSFLVLFFKNIIKQNQEMMEAQKGSKTSRLQFN
jgi:hypothetical protein